MRYLKSGPFKGWDIKSYHLLKAHMRTRAHVPMEYVPIDEVDTDMFEVAEYNPVEAEDFNIAMEDAHALMGALDDDHAFVLRCRFGISRSGKVYTLAEVAEKMGVTNERIRQLEATALFRAKELLEKRDRRKWELTSVLHYTDPETGERLRKTVVI
jgi:DNA-directed RNA polymerase specialized sigma subunit